MAILDPKKLLNVSDSKKRSEPKIFLVPTKNVQYRKIADLSNEDSEQKTDDKTSSLREDIKIIKEKTIKIEDILKKTIEINLKKIELNKRQDELQKRQDKESKLENKKNKKNKNNISKFIPGLSLIERIKQFLGSIFAGFLVLRLVKLLPKLLDFLKFIKPVTDFISNFVSGMLDKLVTGIEIGYNIVDGIESKVKDVFGEEGQKNFNKFTETFTKFMNLAIIAGMVTSGGKDALRDRRFDGSQRKGFDKSGRRVSLNVQRRYRERFGDKKFVERFGRKNLQRLNKPTTSPAPKGTQSSAQRMVQQGATKIAGKRVGAIAGRIPIVGPLIDFGIRTLIFKEPLGKSAAGAVGAGIGQAIGSWIGGAGATALAASTVGLGALAAPALIAGGAFLGGLIGDQIGVSLYNVIKSSSSEPVQSKSGGGSTKKQKKYKNNIRKLNIRKYQPDATNVGKDVGKSKVTLFYGGTNINQPPPNIIALKRISDSLKGSGRSLFSKIASIGVDLTLGQKPSSRSIKSLSSAFSDLLQSVITPNFNIQGFSSGGKVDNIITEYSDKIKNHIESKFSRELNEISNRFKTLSKDSIIRQILQNPLSTTGNLFVNLGDALRSLFRRITGGGPIDQNQQEAFEKIRKIAEKVGSPNPSVTAAIAMLESGWLSNPNSVYFASEKTNPFGQTGKGPKGSVIGKDGQEHAVYNNLEEGVKAHVDRWKSSYIGKDPEEIIESIRTGRGKGAPGQYNTNVNWTSKVLGVYKSILTPKPSKLTNASFSAVLPEGNPQLTSGFGRRIIGWGSKDHKGIDIGVDRGSKVLSLEDGTVSIIPSFMHGSAVVITHNDGTKTLYGHVDPTVKNGDKVKKGQVIAKVKFWPKGVAGATYPDNTHLHLERHVSGKPIDPSGYLNSFKPKPTPKPDIRQPSPSPAQVRTKLTRSNQWKPEDSGLKYDEKTKTWKRASISPSQSPIASKLDTLNTKAPYEEFGTTTIALLDNTVYVPVPMG